MSSDKTQISYQCLKDKDIDRILYVNHRETRIRMRDLVNIINAKNRTNINNRIDTITLRHMMLKKGICKFRETHTYLINRQLFIDTFKANKERIETVERVEPIKRTKTDIALLTVEEAIKMPKSEILKLPLKDAEIILNIKLKMKEVAF